MPGTPLTPYKRVLPTSNMFASTGTWTRVTNTGIPYYSKAAAAETAKISVGIDVVSRDTETGCYLTAIDFPIRVATASLVSTPTVTIYRRNSSLAVAAAGVNMTASTVTGTLTGATLSAAATDRLLTFTVTTPIIDYAKNSKATYTAELVFHAATTSAIRIYDAIAYYSIPA